jgi:hypothetical protein
MRELVAPAPFTAADVPLAPDSTPARPVLTTPTVPMSPRRSLRMVWTASRQDGSGPQLVCRWRPEIYSLPFVR